MTTKKVALVTGANKGIGLEIARQLAQAGIKVLLGARDSARGQQAAAGLASDGLDVEAVSINLNDERTIAATVETITGRYGRLDILMNSVGIGGAGSPTEVTEETWDRVLDVNLKSMVFISKYAIPEMIKTGGGSIINVSSVDGIRAGMTKNIPYNAAKGGMITVTKAMAVHHGRDNIRVNCIAPGLLYTSMTEAMDDRTRQLRRDIAPLGTEGRAQDIAMAASFLASEEARWITGVLLPVDAGLMAAGPQSIVNNILDDYEQK